MACYWEMKRKSGPYPRKGHPVAFCPSSKQSKAGLAMFNPRLGTLECEPVDGGVSTRALTSCHNTGLEATCCHIFNPYKGRIVDLRWLVSMANWSKHSHEGCIGKDTAKWHVVTLKVIVSSLLKVNFPELNSYNNFKENDRLGWQKTLRNHWFVTDIVHAITERCCCIRYNLLTHQW